MRRTKRWLPDPSPAAPCPDGARRRSRSPAGDRQPAGSLRPRRTAAWTRLATGRSPATTSNPELLLDAQLSRAAAWVPATLAAPGIALGALTYGVAGALGALWGLAAVGITAYGAATISARGGRTSRGIGVVRVTAAVPVRLLLIAVALAVGVGPLGFPSRVVALAVCLGEIGVLTAQSWLVLHGRTFVGPLTGKA